VEDDTLGPVTDCTGDTDGDGQLDTGETWIYTKTYIVPAESSDPLVSHATVTAKYKRCHSVSDSDCHSIDILHPCVSIEKTADSNTVSSGDTVTYTYVVTNSGDCTLYNVTVTDDILGDVGTVDKLEPGESRTLTKKSKVSSDTTNVGHVVGYDNLGRMVTDRDCEAVELLGGPITPLGEPTAPKVSAKPAALIVPEEEVLPYTGAEPLMYLDVGLILIAIGLFALRRSKVY
jgi:uncharacterized repeat protein (TIGR01451 family)